MRWERIPILGSLYTKNAERYATHVIGANIVKGLPLPERSCRGVYASHVLEHLALKDFHKAIDNTYRLLEEGGIFRALVPDLEWAAREYLTRLDHGDPAANEFFLRQTDLGRETCPRGLGGFIYSWLRTSAHHWMWDYASLAQALLDHGFKSVRRCAFGDCEDRMFDLVESKHRFENAVAVEARR
jgi:predicted SAM-dependent methyltransferase